jgi:enamine deaminase RidA (YjgF/YER057c/UK114 family)
MGKWIVCLLLATLLVFAVSAEKSGNTPVGMELVPATTPYSPGVLAGGSLYISGLQGTDPRRTRYQATWAKKSPIVWKMSAAC